MRSRVYLLAAFLLAATCGVPRSMGQGYTSPFSIALDSNISTWTSDYSSRVGAMNANTSPAMSDWYSSSTSYATYPYGPLNPQLYSSASVGSPTDAQNLRFDRGDVVLNVPINSVPTGVDAATWQQQRVLAAANILLQAGTAYQHLHFPSFDPTQVTNSGGFTWKPVSTNAMLQSSWQLANQVPGNVTNPYASTYGQPASGIDCTDFTAYAYSIALGIQMHSGTSTQIEFDGASAPTVGGTAKATVLDSSGNPVTPQFFYGPNFGKSLYNSPGSLDSLISQFQPGDLLYMGDPTNGIVHVVMWLGQTGTDSAGNTFPLVISSHDNTPAIFDTQALDSTGFPVDGNIAGHLPPPGVHILPFIAEDWFYQDFQVAMRVAFVPEPSAISLLALGGCVILAGHWRRHRKDR